MCQYMGVGMGRTQVCVTYKSVVRTCKNRIVTLIALRCRKDTYFREIIVCFVHLENNTTQVYDYGFLCSSKDWCV